MKTEIEFLKERVEFLEETLFSVLYILRRKEGYTFIDDPTILFNHDYKNMKNWINGLNEEYKTNVMRVGCRECLDEGGYNPPPKNSVRPKNPTPNPPKKAY